MCVLVCWFLCAFVAAADGHFAFARSCMCQALVLASVREIVCKGTKNEDYKAAKKTLFCGDCHFSLCESAKILYKILKHHIPKQPTSAASLSDKPRLVVQHLLPSSPEGHAFLAQKQCRF